MRTARHWKLISGIVASFLTITIAIVSCRASKRAVQLTEKYHNEEVASKASDEHIGSVISGNPDIKEIKDSMKELNQKVEKLADRISTVEGQLKSVKAKVEDQAQKQGELRAQIQDPQLILGMIRTEIQSAQANKALLPEPKLIRYRKTLFDFQPSVPEYWVTLAAIVNYQSWVNQKKGAAPDPAKISGPCKVLTGGHNNVILGESRDCIVDLDTQAFVGATFIDSVIRYHGGSTSLVNVEFVNCYFVLDLPTSSAPNKLLFARLTSSNQTNVKVD